MEGKLTNWISLSDLRVSDLPRRSRWWTCCAAYAFRDSRNQEILKFGETQDLRRRIFGNYIGGIGGTSKTGFWIHEKIFRLGYIDYVELAWVVTASKAKARSLESQFLAGYKSTHGGRRPKWNRRG
jgi:hypothetical protein